MTIVLIAVIGCAAIWIYGGKKQHYETSLTINATPSQVFPYLTDVERMKQWVDGLMEVEPINELVQVEGAKNRVTVNANGKMVEFEDEVLRYQQDKLLSVRWKNSVVVTTSIYKLEPKSELQTDFRFTVKTTNLGIGRFLAPFAADDTQSRIEKDAQALKKLIENRVTSSAGEYSESVPIGG